MCLKSSCHSLSEEKEVACLGGWKLPLQTGLNILTQKNVKTTSEQSKLRTACVLESISVKTKLHTLVCVHTAMSPRMHTKICNVYPCGWDWGRRKKKDFILSVTHFYLRCVCVCARSCMCTHIYTHTYIYTQYNIKSSSKIMWRENIVVLKLL